MLRIALLNPFFIAFAILPPLLIIAMFIGRIRIPGRVLFLAYVGAGWVSVNLGIDYHYMMLDRLIDSTPNAPQEWVDALCADGAKRAFGLAFGWAYSIVYFMVWFVPAVILREIHHVIRRSKTGEDREGAS